MAVYKNLKTGKLYTVTSEKIINATNVNDGQQMVLYTDGERLFVREKVEFHEKFKEEI